MIIARNSMCNTIVIVYFTCDLLVCHEVCTTVISIPGIIEYSPKGHLCGTCMGDLYYICTYSLMHGDLNSCIKFCQEDKGNF